MESFEEIVEQFTPMIYHVMRTLNLYKNHEEYFQTGLIALWEAYEKFDPEKGKFSSYAYAYIKGHLMMELSRCRREEERSVYPDEAFWDVRVDENVEEPLELATLQTYCQNLTLRQRQWVIYTFYYGMTVQEIADAENVSISAVKKWRAGAKEKLKNEIDSNDL